MRRLRSVLTGLLVTAAVVCGSAIVHAQESPKVDVSGRWSFNVTTDAGTGTPTVTFKQQGDTLTGHYSSPTLGEADLAGSVKDRKITFSFKVEVQGTSLVIRYSGNVESHDTLNGTLDLGGQATGTFSAKRQ